MVYTAFRRVMCQDVLSYSEVALRLTRQSLTSHVDAVASSDRRIHDTQVSSFSQSRSVTFLFFTSQNITSRTNRMSGYLRQNPRGEQYSDPTRKPSHLHTNGHRPLDHHRPLGRAPPSSFFPRAHLL